MENQPKTRKRPSNPYVVQWRMFCEIAGRRKRAKNLFGIEYLFLMSICAGLMFMPTMLVRAVSDRFGYFPRKLAIEFYVIAKPLALLWILFSERAFSTPWATVTTLMFVDLYLYLCGLVFLRRFYTPPASPARSLLLLGVNFLEASLAFAIFYGFSDSIKGATSPLKLLYFSLVTSATVGYGDMMPKSDTGMQLVICQILSSLGFASIFIATFVTKLNEQEAI